MTLLRYVSLQSTDGNLPLPLPSSCSGLIKVMFGVRTYIGCLCVTSLEAPALDHWPHSMVTCDQASMASVLRSSPHCLHSAHGQLCHQLLSDQNEKASSCCSCTIHTIHHSSEFLRHPDFRLTRPAGRSNQQYFC